MEYSIAQRLSLFRNITRSSVFVPPDQRFYALVLLLEQNALVAARFTMEVANFRCDVF